MYYNFYKDVIIAVCIILGSAFIFDIYAQDQRAIDSLQNLLQGSQDEKEIMGLKVELGWYYLNRNDAKAYKYSFEGYELAMQFGDSAKMVKAGRVAGQALRRLDRLQESIDLLTAVLPIAKRNQIMEEYKKILNSLALAHTFKAEYDIALKYNFQSLVIRESEGDKKEISTTLNNIGLVYFKLHNYEGALKYYNQCLSLKREVRDTTNMELLYTNLGLCYLHLKKYKEAKDYTLQALAFCGTKCDDDIIITSEFGLGVSSYWMGNYHDAVEHLNKSLAVAGRKGDKRWQAENLVYLGLVSIDNNEKDYAGAIKYLNEADSIAQKAGYNQILIETYRHFSKLYNQTEDFKKEAFYQKKYIQLADSLIGQELVKNIGKIQADYEERENIATIASKEVLIKQQRDLNVAVAVIALLAGLLILVLQFGNRNIKRVNAKLSEAKEVIQKQNQELENKNRELDIEVDKKTVDLASANQSLKQVNEELDNFIYKTSHDIRGPLASLKGMCNVALLDVTDPVALDYLRKLDTTAERLNSILTRLVIINQINNSKLSSERIDFKAIVNDVLMLEKKKGLPPDLKIDIDIDPEASIESDKELVRIVLENLIDNAIKFYNDSERVDSFLDIHISQMDNDSVKVRVVDNGIGISESNPGKLFQMFSRASERSETGGIGLYITKTATEKIGGKIGLLTTPEGYTEFYVIFPAMPNLTSEKLKYYAV
ncbi:MAG: tetratricopeptide repeat-containing sensor histidine kinase [Cyclobacteriaceae bacterium]|nr:tetratricopeptide repeat-containing sensor histidine kinase [Cyclobacteriaceae bacterium]MDH5251385.1 tetratricopeptide repeat-containing sensor histidine kinase [Cyclobacteriaceae bacterium]